MGYSPWGRKEVNRMGETENTLLNVEYEVLFSSLDEL